VDGVGVGFKELWVAICLMLVLEGILPFAHPTRWRRLVVVLANIDDRKLRMMGLSSMLLGVGLLYFVSK
jgi:uncharacterized protein YjeT (DUF2065 family)